MLHKIIGLETNRVKRKTHENPKKKTKLLNGPKIILKIIFSLFWDKKRCNNILGPPPRRELSKNIL